MAQSTNSRNRTGSETRDWEDEAARLQRRANDFLRERPLLALTMALAGGYLAGRMLSRV